MDVKRRIEEARRRFAGSLVGRWDTAVESFEQVMAQHWEILPDGTSRFIDTGPFGYPRSTTRFEWQQPEDFLFELRLTEFVANHPDDVRDLDDEDRQRQVIRYEFVATPSDFGVVVGLIDVELRGPEFAGSAPGWPRWPSADRKRSCTPRSTTSRTISRPDPDMRKVRQVRLIARCCGC